MSTSQSSGSSASSDTVDYRAQNNHHCYYCKEGPLTGERYVYTYNDDYSSCKSCRPNNTQWRRANSDTKILRRCFECKKAIHDVRYEYEKGGNYSLCESCMPRYNMYEFNRHEKEDTSSLPQCLHCEKTSFQGGRYVDKKSGAYSLCKDCKPYFNSRDWHRKNELYRHDNEDTSSLPQCLHCEKTSFQGRRYVDKKSGAYSLCKDCKPYYHSKDWHRLSL